MLAHKENEFILQYQQELEIGVQFHHPEKIQGQGMLRIFFFSLFLSAVASSNAFADPCEALLPQSGVFEGQVTYIVDGDGLCVGKDRGGGIEVRLGDFNAPELNAPGGLEAKKALQKLVFGKSVVCTVCEGARNPKNCISYDRVVATCRLAGDRLGDLMRALGVKEGGR